MNRKMSEMTKPTRPDSERKIQASLVASSGRGMPRDAAPATTRKPNAKTSL
ncbi:MAG TPA: hypothetical protein PLI66_08150 [Spirochaetales bacterium]|nr:hypothetical protein [Spirochaetales bacterium]